MTVEYILLEYPKYHKSVSRQVNTHHWIDLKAIIPSVHLSVVWYAFVVYYIVNDWGYESVECKKCKVRKI